jgi:transcription elongation factor GreA
MDKIPMTAAGYAALEAELKECQSVERPRIIQQITDARTHGDLSENAEYHATSSRAPRSSTCRSFPATRLRSALPLP